MRRCKLQGVVAQRFGQVPREYLAQYGACGCDPVAVRLYASRVYAGLTVPEMAAALGVHRSTVSRWELGKIHTMSCDHLSGWARVTGVPYNWLLHNEGLPGGKLAALVGEGRRWVKPHIKPLPSSLGIVSDWWQYKEREKARAAGSDEWDRAGSAPVKSDRF